MPVSVQTEQKEFERSWMEAMSGWVKAKRAWRIYKMAMVANGIEVDGPDKKYYDSWQWAQNELEKALNVEMSWVGDQGESRIEPPNSSGAASAAEKREDPNLS